MGRESDESAKTCSLCGEGARVLFKTGVRGVACGIEMGALGIHRVQWWAHLALSRAFGAIEMQQVFGDRKTEKAGGSIGELHGLALWIG